MTLIFRVRPNSFYINRPSFYTSFYMPRPSALRRTVALVPAHRPMISRGITSAGRVTLWKFCLTGLKRCGAIGARGYRRTAATARIRG
jgi:hypothetical protein